MTVAEILATADGWKNGFTPLFRAVADIRGEMSRRIFGTESNSGSNTAGETLPTRPYDNDPIYVDPRSIPGAKGSNVGKRGKPIKSLYFKGGYAQLKAELGRPALELTNALDLSFTNTPIVEAGDNAAIVIDDSEAGKVAGLERQYGTIFQMTEEEERIFGEILADYITEELNR